MSAGISSMSAVEDVDNMKALYGAGKMKLRVSAYINMENAEAQYARGREIGLFGDRLSVQGIKFYIDGSLGSRTALMLEDYSDKPGARGVLRNPVAKLEAGMMKAAENGFQISTHAIGDAGVRTILDLYEKVLAAHPRRDHRHRIEHFQHTTQADIDRLGRMGVVPAMQTVHATSDKNMAELRVGADRIKYGYAWRKVLKAGAVIPNGSDAPNELLNPYHGLYAAVTRMDRDGNPAGGWYPEERLTRAEALKSFTLWAAYGQFEERLKGSLEKGKLADFVVVDRDFMTCPTSEIKDIQALMTVLGGEVVYQVPPR